MSKTNDGGPAFPTMPPVDDTGRTAVGYPYPDSGMSLRDWFAGMALQGMLAGEVDDANEEGFPSMKAAVKHYSASAYLYADAMLAARLPSPEKEET